MQIFWPVWEVFVNTVETLLFCILLNKKLGYAPNKLGRIWGGFLAIILLLSILNHSQIDYRLVMVLILLVDILYALWAHDGDRGHRIFWGCSHTVIAFVCNSIVLSFFGFLQGVNSSDVFNQTQLRFQLMCLYLLALLIIYMFLYNINTKKTVIPTNIQFLLIALLTTGTFVSGLLININFHLTDLPSVARMVVLVNGLFLVIMIGIMFIFEYMGIINKQNLDLELTLQQERLEKSHNQHMIEIYDALRAWKHDYNNHLLVIKSYAQKCQCEDLLIYVGGLSQQFNQLTQFVYTGNTAVDALLTNKLLVTSTQNIPTKVSVQLPDSLPISNLDFCSLLANLLDNAIESCQRLPAEQKSESYIDLRIETKLGMLSINVNNRSDGVYSYENQRLISRKKEENHGWGLKRIENIVKSANGFLDFKAEDTSFTVNILIPLYPEEI